MRFTNSYDSLMTVQKNPHHTLDKKSHLFIGITVILLGFLVVSFIEPAPHVYANEFLKMPIRVHPNPTICALEPQPNATFSKIGSQLLDKTEYAVLDWKTKLNAGLGKHPIWNINLMKIFLGQQNGFNYTKCDITIHFLPKPQSKSKEFVLAGITIPNFETGRTNIEIYYLDVQPNWQEFEWTEGKTAYYTYLFKPYYTGLVATDTQLSGTIEHEIGHSFGLGHYTVTDEERDKIVKGLEDMPSIMIDTATILGVTHFDITQLDINEIKSIYGDRGFDYTHLSNAGYQRTPILSTSKSSYSVDDRIKISIDTNKFTNDTLGALLIIDSNSRLTDDFSISKSNSTIYLSDKYNNENGKYWIEFINPYTGDYDFATFTSGIEKIASNNMPPQQTPSPSPIVTSIPSWIKNNAKWWHEGSIGDEDFEKGIQYMIQQKIMKIPQTASGNVTSNHVPTWVKNNAGFWGNGQISDEDFVKGIQYLITNGIIKS